MPPGGELSLDKSSFTKAVGNEVVSAAWNEADVGKATTGVAAGEFDIFMDADS